MFIQNKYYKWYNNIINNAKLCKRKKLDINDVFYIYYELHHIVPKSLGGSNKKENLVLLTAKEHFICHHLLIKIANNKDHKIKMLHAFWRMLNSKQNSSKVCSRIYENTKKQRSLLLSERSKGKMNNFYGKKHSEDTKKIMKEKAKYRDPNNYKGRKGRYSWNEGLTKENSEILRIISENRKKEKNPMFGRTGKNHPNTKSTILISNIGNKIIEFNSRFEVEKYCKENKLPFSGLYKTLVSGIVYHDTTRSKKFTYANGMMLIYSPL